jgi:protoheme IX farnesyltransferase
MLAEGTFFARPLDMTLCLLAIMAAAGSANTLNQIIDLDIDSLMERTRKKRPLPREAIHVSRAILFAVFLGVSSSYFLWNYFNPLSAWISMGTILFYIVIYTIWLKRRHHYNIVIGGAAGSTAPLIASAAAFGHVSWLAWLGFWIIFTWTPPHFWALALAIKDDYAKAKIPMLPNVAGDRRTKIEIIAYTVVLIPLTVVPLILKEAHLAIVIVTAGLGGYYLFQTVKQLNRSNRSSYMRLFYFSILYLFFIFLFLSAEGIGRWMTGGTLWV